MRRTVTTLLGVVLLCASSRTAAAPAPTIATLHPKGGISDRIRGRAEAQSTKNLVLLLRCLEYVTHNLVQPAIEACHSAISLDPTNPTAYKLRGNAFLLSGKYRAARADFDRAIKRDNRDPEAYAGRGDALRGLRLYQAAITSYSAALSLSPADARLWNSRCWTRAISGRGLSLAHRDCDRAIAINAKFSQAFDSRGLVHLKQRHYRDAIADYNRALALWPGYAVALFGRGVAEWRGGLPALAVRDFREAQRNDLAVAAKFARLGVSLSGIPALQKKGCRGNGCRSIAPTILPKPKPAKAVPPPNEVRSAAR